jgi:predicted unusual protein kinase regulating ubiquinone biosynthesis (AarF/ABC1/UbiB family)
VGSVLLPIYLGYLWPWLRMRVFGAAIAPEVWRRKHVAGAAAFYRLAVRMKGGLIKVGQILSTRVDLLPPSGPRACHASRTRSGRPPPV